MPSLGRAVLVALCSIFVCVCIASWFCGFELFSFLPPRSFDKFKVELLPLSTSSSLAFFDSKHTDKLRPIFALMLRRSSGHHPLLAGALCEWVGRIKAMRMAVA